MPAPPLWFVLLVCDECGRVEQTTAAHTEDAWDLPKHCGLPMVIAGTQLVIPQSPLVQ